jgi:hypothetical protein
MAMCEYDSLEPEMIEQLSLRERTKRYIQLRLLGRLADPAGVS